MFLGRGVKQRKGQLVTPRAGSSGERAATSRLLMEQDDTLLLPHPPSVIICVLARP